MHRRLPPPLRRQPRIFAIFLIAACAYLTSTNAQEAPKSSTAPTPPAPRPLAACPAAADTTHRHLIGDWSAVVGTQEAVVLTLVQHPELADSVRGQLVRKGQRVLLSGDVEDGDLTLEESTNGTTISATWIGRVVDGSCGKEIRGTWTAPPSPTPTPFVLRKRLGAPGQW